MNDGMNDGMNLGPNHDLAAGPSQGPNPHYERP
jgi:hypothetical protein